jgi:anti-sigma-K factor RskA
MDLDRLRALLDAHGPSPATWPEGVRDAAQALLDASVAARAELAAAQRLHTLLDADVPAPAPHLAAAVLARAPRARAGWRATLRELWDGVGGARLALPAFAAALALGISLGLLLDPPAADDGDEAELLNLAQLDTDYDGY